MSFPAIIAGRYRVLRELGRGGMGVVYLVRHTQTKEYLALKVMLDPAKATPDAIVRFKREIEAPAHIRSEHVVRIVDADIAQELNGAPFLVMELLDGLSVEQGLKQRGNFRAEEVIWILGQVSKALDKAHLLGVIHRDLKPENLFIHRRTRDSLMVKVLDFGIARMTEPTNLGITEAKLTQTGAILGTPMYLSPEQATGNSTQIGPASDMWSIGLIAFELLVGKSYWTAETVTSLIGQILFAPLPPATERAPTLPRAFDEWFAQSCNRNPAQRWPSVAVQVEALAKALEVSADWLINLNAPEQLAATMSAHPMRLDSSGAPTELPAEDRPTQLAGHRVSLLLREWLRSPIFWIVGTGVMLILIISILVTRPRSTKAVTTTKPVADTPVSSNNEDSRAAITPALSPPEREVHQPLPGLNQKRKPAAVVRPSTPVPAIRKNPEPKPGAKKYPGVTTFEAAAP